jgi:hypothetical protein
MIGARAICGNRPSFFLQILRSSGIRRTGAKEPTETLHCFDLQRQLHVDSSRAIDPKQPLVYIASC